MSFIFAGKSEAKEKQKGRLSKPSLFVVSG